jgi:hypothetical protein
MGKPDSEQFNYRKGQISFNVLCDQTLYFQTPQGLLETLIGLDLTAIDAEFRRQLYDQPIFKDMVYITMKPSLLMALLSSRFGIFWLLNVMFLICVPVSVYRLHNKREKVSV